MQLIIKGNRSPFQISQEVKYIDLILTGSYNSSFTLEFDGKVLEFKDQNFYRFGQRIQGSFQTGLVQALKEFKFTDEVIQLFNRKSQTEIGLFKAVFLIYNWTEIAFTDAYAVSLGSLIYNEFIIDNSNKIGPQNDIYFISRSLLTQENQQYIDRLLEINLLAFAEFRDNALGNFSTYFIPLVRPGVSREHFISKTDTTGIATHNFWKRILQDRDARLRNWMTNRS